MLAIAISPVKCHFNEVWLHFISPSTEVHTRKIQPFHSIKIAFYQQNMLNNQLTQFASICAGVSSLGSLNSIISDRIWLQKASLLKGNHSGGSSDFFLYSRRNALMKPCSARGNATVRSVELRPGLVLSHIANTSLSSSSAVAFILFSISSDWFIIITAK